MWRTSFMKKCTVILWIGFINVIFLITLKCKLFLPTCSFENMSKDMSFSQQLSGNTMLGTSHMPLWNQTLDFDKLKFSNETGNPTGCYVVPNYLHYVNFGGNPFNYVEMICALAAFKHQHPEKIFFHHDDKNRFTGKYWEVLAKTPGYMDVVEFHEVECPEEIFGQPLSKGWKVWHGGDITRLRMIMKYGGIFMDNDCYMVKSVDNYRRFEITVNWDQGQFLGSQVIITHKDARFLKKWLDTYKVYDKSKWYYNAGERPTREVLYKEPELVHRVKVLFGAATKYGPMVFQKKWEAWKDMYFIHLLMRHQYLFKTISEKATYPVKFNETNIAYYPIAFREMAYDVYDVANLTWPQYRFDT